MRRCVNRGRTGQFWRIRRQRGTCCGRRDRHQRPGARLPPWAGEPAQLARAARRVCGAAEGGVDHRENLLPAGRGRRRVAAGDATTESTFGTGQKTLRGTVPASRAPAYQASLADGTRTPGCQAPAHIRSATSACTITTPRASDGPAARRSSTMGPATSTAGWPRARSARTRRGLPARRSASGASRRQSSPAQRIPGTLAEDTRQLGGEHRAHFPEPPAACRPDEVGLEATAPASAN